MSTKKLKTVNRSDWFDYVNIVFLVGFSLLVLYPVWTQIIISLSSSTEASKPGLHVWVERPTLASYERIFAQSTMITAFFWSTVRLVLGTVISLFVCACLAYPLSRRNLWNRNLWTALLVFTMFFGGGLIPSYLVVRDLGLMNTIWALVLPGATVPFYVLMIRTYMMGLPEEMVESAKIDGANDVKILSAIILPLCAPILATVALWLAVANWNAWFDVMLYIQKPPIVILQTILRDMLMEAGQQAGGDSVANYINQEMAQATFTPESIRAATLVVITLPIICTYPFLQKYFVKGVMMGSLKG